jgi:hypothetical protein
VAESVVLESVVVPESAALAPSTEELESAPISLAESISVVPPESALGPPPESRPGSPESCRASPESLPESSVVT